MHITVQYKYRQIQLVVQQIQQEMGVMRQHFVNANHRKRDAHDKYNKNVSQNVLLCFHQNSGCINAHYRIIDHFKEIRLRLCHVTFYRL